MRVGPKLTGARRGITPRQIQVIAGLLTGLGAKEIAGTLNISPRCVKYHASQIYRRYEVASREGLLAKFGRFEIDVRWVASCGVEPIDRATARVVMPAIVLPRLHPGPGGMR